MSCVIRYFCQTCYCPVYSDDYCTICNTCGVHCECGWFKLQRDDFDRDTLSEITIYDPCPECGTCVRDTEFCRNCSLCPSCCKCGK